MCGLTSGLATADVTEGPFVRVCVDELRVLRSIADVDKTELCRHKVHRESQQIIQGVCMN